MVLKLYGAVSQHPSATLDVAAFLFVFDFIVLVFFYIVFNQNLQEKLNTIDKRREITMLNTTNYEAQNTKKTKTIS